jgi:hypothetical protein
MIIFFFSSLEKNVVHDWCKLLKYLMMEILTFPPWELSSLWHFPYENYHHFDTFPMRITITLTFSLWESSSLWQFPYENYHHFDIFPMRIIITLTLFPYENYHHFDTFPMRIIITLTFSIWELSSLWHFPYEGDSLTLTFSMRVTPHFDIFPIGWLQL